MKKMFLALLICVICIGGLVSLVLHKIYYSNDIAIRINDSDDSYRIYASYPMNKTNRLQHYLDAKLHSRAFNNSRVNGFLTLEDRTHLYIKTRPGKLLIKMNKRDNDFESFSRLKQLGEGIKIELTQN